jgi:hypothetical protein
MSTTSVFVSLMHAMIGAIVIGMGLGTVRTAFQVSRLASLNPQAPRALAWLMVMCVMLMGLVCIIGGTYTALGYDTANSYPYLPTLDTPPLGWVLWVLSATTFLGGLVSACGALIIALLARRGPQLTQRETPHDA